MICKKEKTVEIKKKKIAEMFAEMITQSRSLPKREKVKFKEGRETYSKNVK